MKITLEIKNWGIVFHSDNWTWKGRNHGRPISGYDGFEDSVNYFYGYFTYWHQAEPKDWLAYYKRLDKVDELLEFHHCATEEEYLERYQ